MGKTWGQRRPRYKKPERDTPKSRRERGLKNRRRVERAESGGCAKRMWRDLDQAKEQAQGALAHTINECSALAIYECWRCGCYHQSRQLDGPNVVAIVRRD
jgi:hypothetical protein